MTDRDFDVHAYDQGFKDGWQESLAEIERLQDQAISGQNDGYDMAKNIYCAQIIELEDENANLREALEDFVNVMDLLSMRVGLTVGEIADHINPVVDKARAALGGE